MTSNDQDTMGSSASERRLTPRQEKFAHGYVALGSAAAAYRQAYDAENMARKSVHEAASRLLRNRKVAARIKEIRDRTAQEYGVTRMGLLLELDQAFAIAKVDRKASAMVAAITAKAKLVGFIDHIPSPTKERPVVLPTGDLLAAHERVMTALAVGEIGAADAQVYAGLIDGRRRLMETLSFEARLAAVETRLPGKTARN
jgi:phage terminase small subunit